MKLTDKPRSFIESGVDSHSSRLAQIAKTPAEAGLCKKLKLTDKPRSFIESGVDSHSSRLAQIAKTP
ncbi:hypothetical protein, partial [Enterobacter ludwigii]|uniref:hypothetical protein n=1 Tax=Enterobacter ludwigii TaxID=299767 RepID=UPI0039766CCC